MAEMKQTSKKKVKPASTVAAEPEPKPETELRKISKQLGEKREALKGLPEGPGDFGTIFRYIDLLKDIVEVLIRLFEALDADDPAN